MAASDRMNLHELIKKYEEAIPTLEQKAADIIARNSAWTIHPGETPLDIVRKGGHHAVLGMGILDFLCWAFDEPHLGYVPNPDLERRPE